MAGNVNSNSLYCLRWYCGHLITLITFLIVLLSVITLSGWSLRTNSNQLRTASIQRFRLFAKFNIQSLRSFCKETNRTDKVQLK